ncbi:MAG TPA: DUF3999 family protein, partial [Thermoanaerobaculia bacterium]|nr:DUF3999 family protein [Thermoanaerobaculia bacterium]
AGSGDRVHWTILVEQGTLFDLPEERLQQLEVDIPSGKLQYLRWIWDDTSSALVPLPGKVEVRLDRPADPPSPTRATVTFERRPSEPGKSRFHLRLPGARLPVVALDLAVAGGPLLRDAVVTEGRLPAGSATGGATEILPERLGEATLRRAVRNGLTAADLRLPILAPQGPDLELTVDDGSNPPLPLTGVTAELAPLPWIYFEAASPASPWIARFGDPRAAAPRYDLEAVRESASQGPLAAARWGEIHERPPAESALRENPLPALGAPLDRSRFRYQRPVPAAPPGLASLLLDAAVLSRSPDLADVRLIDTAGRQVPYLAEKRDEPQTLALPAPVRRAGPRDPATLSRYPLSLPYPSLPDARLVFTTPARVFEREIRLAERAEPEPGSEASRERAEPGEHLLAVVTWRHADPDSPAPPLTLPLPFRSATQLYLLIEEGDNAPLPLGPPQLLLPAPRLRFFAPPSPVTLLYGQPGLAPPRYDLSLLAPRLLAEAAHEITLAPETGKAVEDPDTAALGRKIFWGVLVAAVLALLVLLGRLLRGAAPSAG